MGRKMTIANHPGLLFWSLTSEATRHDAQKLLSAIVRDNVDELVGKFYSAFLSHDEASAFLSHSVVSERLSHSLRNWLLDLIATDPHGDLAAFDARQIKIGESMPD